MQANNDNSQERALRELQLSSAQSSGCQAAGFQHNRRLWVFKASIKLDRRVWEHSTLKHHKAHCSYKDSIIFFLNKCSQCFCKPLVNFKSPEKIDSDHFSSVLIAFIGKGISVVFTAPFSVFFLQHLKLNLRNAVVSLGCILFFRQLQKCSSFQRKRHRFQRVMGE